MQQNTPKNTEFSRKNACIFVMDDKITPCQTQFSPPPRSSRDLFCPYVAHDFKSSAHSEENYQNILQSSSVEGTFKN